MDVYMLKSRTNNSYLNVDYELSDRSVVDLIGQNFVWNNTLTDSKLNKGNFKWEHRAQ
jgi:hypothetical protein